jgi:hypothetical protein
MTTGPIGSSFGAVDPLLVLLAKQIEVEREYQRHEDAVRVASRNAKLAADAAAVEALHEQADAIRAGAWVSLGFTAAGAAAEGVSIAAAPGACGETPAAKAEWAAARDLSRAFAAGGRALSSAAEPAGRLVGDARATDAQARGAFAKSRADDAQSSHEGAHGAKQKSENHVAALIDQIQHIIESARQAIDHVLSRF